MGSHGAPASSTRTRAPLLLHQTLLGETPGVGADGKGVQIEGKNKPGRKADPGVSEAWLPIGAGSGCPAAQRPWLGSSSSSRVSASPPRPSGTNFPPHLAALDMGG